MLPELYLHGLTLGDFDLALRGLLGEDAPLSAATVSRLKEQWHAEQAHWASRSLTSFCTLFDMTPNIPRARRYRQIGACFPLDMLAGCLIYYTRLWAVVGAGG